MNAKMLFKGMYFLLIKILFIGFQKNIHKQTFIIINTKSNKNNKCLLKNLFTVAINNDVLITNANINNKPFMFNCFILK